MAGQRLTRVTPRKDYMPGRAHTKPRQQFLALVTEVTGNVNDAAALMDAMELWSKGGGGKPPTHVLTAWYDNFVDKEEVIPERVRVATVKQADAFMRWQVRRPMQSAAAALITLNEKLRDGEVPPGGPVSIKYVGDQLGFLGRVSSETGKGEGRIVMPGARITIDAGPRPKKRIASTAAKTAEQVIDAEYKELPVG